MINELLLLRGCGTLVAVIFCRRIEWVRHDEDDEKHAIMLQGAAASVCISIADLHSLVYKIDPCRINGCVQFCLVPCRRAVAVHSRQPW